MQRRKGAPTIPKKCDFLYSIVTFDWGDSQVAARHAIGGVGLSGWVGPPEGLSLGDEDAVGELVVDAEAVGAAVVLAVAVAESPAVGEAAGVQSAPMPVALGHGVWVMAPVAASAPLLTATNVDDAATAITAASALTDGLLIGDTQTSLIECGNVVRSAQPRGPRIRTSPRRIVAPVESSHSHSGTAYFREVLRRSRI